MLFAGAMVYSVLVYINGTAHATADNIPADAAKGKLVYQEYNCQACHQIYGLGGYMGPDLTNVISSPGKGELYARALMMSGTAKMPNLNLSEQELTHLTEYLKYIDKTGRFPLFDPEINMWGDINLPAHNLNTAQK
ncbi:MAG: c-type cytochrome [Bacteroidia bacterium]